MIAPPIQPLDRMTIEQFVAQSLGQWRSMRSGHSLAFQQFEDVLSEIKIEAVNTNHRDIQELIKATDTDQIDSFNVISPFKMEWSAESDWEPDDPTAVSSGQCILVPYQIDESHGHIIRSVGYAEAEQAITDYSFSSDGTLVLRTVYGQSIAEERIWFASDNVRCRSSILKTSEGSGILQTSFASEVRKLSKA
jgi:phycoerythrin-associated linker protein